MDRKRPGGVLVILVVGFLLGGLGTCGGAFSIFSQIAQDQMQEFSREMAAVSSAGNDAIYEQQMQLQERVEELTASWRPALIVQQILNLLASAALFAGCILLVRWSPSGPTVFLAAALASIVIDTTGSVMALWIQHATSALMQDYMAGITAADPNMPAGMERTMGAAMSAGAGVGICFGVGWLVAKLAFYVGGVVYLRKPEVRALFSPAAASGLQRP